MQDVQARSQLLPLLRSPLLGELLAWIYLHPEEECSVTDLARRFGVSQSTVSREADRLTAAALIHETRRGNLRLLRANLDGPLAHPLTELLMLTYGPAAVLGDVLAGVRGIALYALAFLISALASYVLLSRQRDVMSAALSRRLGGFGRRAAEFRSRIEDGAAAEDDPADDAAEPVTAGPDLAEAKKGT